MALTVEEYNKAEEEAEINIPNRILESSRPDTFMDTGYPVRVKNTKALFRYLDVMHESDSEEDFQNLTEGGLTEEEFELIQNITRKTAEFSEKYFGRRAIPTGSLLRAVPVLRHIRMLYPNQNETIMEIGPGSGYLPASLALLGYSVVTTDITQAFYLWQNHLWEYLFGKKLIELVSDSRNFTDFSELPKGSILHLPWWKYSILNPQDIKLNVDVVTANHVFTEMQNDSFHYLLKLSRQLLIKDESSEKMLIFEGTGGHGKIPMRLGFDVHRLFCEHGFTIASWTIDEVSVLIPQHKYPESSSLYAWKIRLFYAIKQHLTNPLFLLRYGSQFIKSFFGHGLNTYLKRIKEIYKLRSIKALKETSSEKGVYIDLLSFGTPKEIKNLNNPITQKINNSKINLNKCITWKQLIEFQIEVHGSDNFLSDDAIWWKNIYADNFFGSQGLR